MSTLKIILHNNKTQLVGEKVLINEIREDKAFKLKTPGYFHMVRMGRANGWDGYKRYITEGGLIQTGLVPKLIKYLKDEYIPYEAIDKRDLFKDNKDITSIGEFELRGYQKEAVEATLDNRLLIGDLNIRFQRGILNEATNSGKTQIAAAIYSSYHSKRNGLWLINSKTLFVQAVKELSELLGSDTVGQVSSAKTDWKSFNVCMVQTLVNRIKSNPKIKRDLTNTDILIVDEGDELIGRKDTRYILDHAHNAPVRISLTGTSGLSKNKIKNLDEIAFFGPVVHVTTNKELVDQGYSAVPHITILKGNEDIAEDDYQLEYENAIIKNNQRNKRVWKRVLHHSKRGRLPLLILFKYHAHAKYLLATMPNELREAGYVIKVAHGKIKNREYLLKQFREEKIDILLCSMIIRRGKNLPRMRTLINAAAGDSHANALQILGRGLRKEEGHKEEIYFDDFFDQGNYLRKHSKHRAIYYRNQGFPIKELYKNK